MRGTPVHTRRQSPPPQIRKPKKAKKARYFGDRDWVLPAILVGLAVVVVGGPLLVAAPKEALAFSLVVLWAIAVLGIGLVLTVLIFFGAARFPFTHNRGVGMTLSIMTGIGLIVLSIWFMATH
jgi:sterol desaturase/sphingolipid hydroxylase (fatty acid hydroxylase superfamily)